MLGVSPEFDGARLNVRETAELVSMDPGYFRRLIRRGVFPQPKRTQTGLPFFDYELLCQLAEVIRTRIGVNGEEIMWHRRKPKPSKAKQPRQQKQDHRQQQPDIDTYVATVLEGCRQVGVPDERLTPELVTAALVASFGKDRPAPQAVIPIIARRLLTGK